MSNLRVNIAKEFSNLPRPKISKPIIPNFKYPELLDETYEIGTGWKIDSFTEDARIPQPNYDVASEIIPLKSNIYPLEVKPSKSTSLHGIDFNFQSVKVDGFITRIEPTIMISRTLFEGLSSYKLSIYGMNYADKHWQKIATYKADNTSEQQIGKPNEQKKEGPFSERKKRGKNLKLINPHLHYGICSLLYCNRP